MKQLGVFLILALSLTHVQAQDESTVVNGKKYSHELALNSSSTQPLSLTYRIHKGLWYGLVETGENPGAEDAMVVGAGIGRTWVVNEKSALLTEASVTGHVFIPSGKGETSDKGYKLATLYRRRFSNKLSAIGGVLYHGIENNTGTGDEAKSTITSLNKLKKLDLDAMGHYLGWQVGINYTF